MFQTQVNRYLAAGIAGEYADDSPHREDGFILLSNGDANPTIGYAFTLSEDDETCAVAGGTGAFAGILTSPKTFVNQNGLEAGLELDEGVQGGLCTMGRIYVKSATAFEPGYIAAFDTTTGAISAYADESSAEGTVIENAVFIKYSGDADEIGILQLN